MQEKTGEELPKSSYLHLMNNMIIHTPKIELKLEKELNLIEEELIIISAFCKIETIKWIDSHLRMSVKKTCLVRFRMEDILKGSTDFEIYEYCIQNNWTIYFNFKLHSKIYCFDKSSYLIGSANLTQSGIGLSVNANIESMVFGNMGLEDYLEIKEIVDSSILMDESTINDFKRQLLNIPPIEKVKAQEWIISRDLENSIEKIKLKIEDLIKSPSPLNLTKEDKKMLNLNGMKNDLLTEKVLMNQFVETKIFRWLYRILKEKKEIYYGSLSMQLHENLSENYPYIKREEVKMYLSNLLKWIQYFNLEFLEIDRPNYSQRIRLKV
ncbi:phospholipase D family protein [Planococcus sp. X10-3]|uniref:phospholipase D family protein n=1 Tax=Planococcus sp. X10-3 TaxID=3061240 RepID=UPI003BB0724C